MQKDFNKDKKIYFVPLQKHPKWQTEIKPKLQNLQQMKYNTSQIIDSLVLFNQKYCWRRKQFNQFQKRKQPTYKALLTLYREELPLICKIFAEALLKLKPQSIFLMMGQKKQKNSYKGSDLLYILLLMFFSLTPKQYSDGKQELQQRFNNMNTFSHILSNSLFKTQCLVVYLRYRAKSFLQNKLLDEIFTIVRNVQNKKLTVKDLIASNREKTMNKLIINPDTSSIEQYNGEIKIDFANRFIGGGCLRDGCVQEEIMFAERPPLYATTLLCQKMEDNQSLGFLGFERLFNHTGYANSTKYAGKAKLHNLSLKGGQKAELIVAIDAIKFKPGGKEQFQNHLIDREIFKAYVGFNSLTEKGTIITGGWGCGVYHGDIQTKLLIQWIAATLANRELIFCPFGKKKILEENEILKSLQSYPLEKTYEMLQLWSEIKLKQRPNDSLFCIASNLEKNN